MKKVYTVTDLGPGDGGKGGVVHKIALMQSAHTIIKVGGAQGSHGVTNSKGEKFAFSQWGCGTLEGIRTHLTPQIVVMPVAMLNEADALEKRCSIYDPFRLLTVDEDCLCATPFHGITSRLKEMALRDKPRGTIGTGVGEAYRDSVRVPELSIHVRDLVGKGLRDKLAAVRQEQLKKLETILAGEFFPEDLDEVAQEASRLRSNEFLDYVVKSFQEVARRAKIVDHAYLGKEILSQEGVAVVESSHGILTDHYYGFHPHTSAIRTLPCFTQAMIEEAGFTGQVVKLGVTRAYAIRHGAGPIPTADSAMAERLLPGSHKEINRYQGEVRVGPMDLVLLRYALEVCGGPTAFDGLAITWFDQIQTNGVWQICDSYDGTTDDTYFSSPGNLKVRRGTDDAQLAYQEGLGQLLLSCKPNIEDIPTANCTREELFKICAETLKARLGTDVRMMSFGPTELDKMCM